MTSRKTATVARAIKTVQPLGKQGLDKINPPSTVENIAKLYGDRATTEVLDGMGHWLIGEPGWEKLAERALAWLKVQKL